MTRGDRIRELREAMGLTVWALAAKANLSEQRLESLEAGADFIRVTEMSRLAQALEVTHGYLSGTEEVNDPLEASSLFQLFKRKLSSLPPEKRRAILVTLVGGVHRVGRG